MYFLFNSRIPSNYFDLNDNKQFNNPKNSYYLVNKVRYDNGAVDKIKYICLIN